MTTSTVNHTCHVFTLLTRGIGPTVRQCVHCGREYNVVADEIPAPGYLAQSVEDLARRVTALEDGSPRIHGTAASAAAESPARASSDEGAAGTTEEGQAIGRVRANGAYSTDDVRHVLAALDRATAELDGWQDASLWYLRDRNAALQERDDAHTRIRDLEAQARENDDEIGQLKADCDKLRAQLAARTDATPLEDAAKIIYDAMIEAAKASVEANGHYPPWVDGGNSHMQTAARRAARRIEHAPRPVAPVVVEQMRAMVLHLYATHYADNGVPIVPLDTAEGLLSQISNMVSGLTRAAASAPNPFAAFVEALKTDREMQWSYHCNVAMAAYDKGVSHRVANEAAALFLEWLLGDYTPLHDDYLKTPPAYTDAEKRVWELLGTWSVDIARTQILSPPTALVDAIKALAASAPALQVVGACVVKDGKITDHYTFSAETQEKRESYAASWASKNGGTAHRLYAGERITEATP